MRILLEFAPEQGRVARARLEYAFRLFCAIYGHEPIIGEPHNNSSELVLTYAPDCCKPDSVRLTNADFIRPLHEPAPEPIPYTQQDDVTVVFHAPASECEPDWLSEVFEWVSCADEYASQQLDSVGRVPFEACYIGRHGLNPHKPYAAMAMAFLQRAIARVKPQVPIRPLSPVASAEHLVVNTHDVDLLGLKRIRSSYRIAKNAFISFALYRRPRVAAQQSKAAVQVALGAPDPLDQIDFVTEQERKRNASASYYFLCRRGHRRDGNYSLQQASQVMCSLQDAGVEVGVHGSYRSMERLYGLGTEFDQMHRLGFRPIGTRQHWLRFTVAQLVRNVECAGAAYDTSLGWPDHAGFRAGACFAFPPYDFEREAPVNFLEIPLALMDREALEPGDSNGADPITETLTASRRYGWGGISVVWHPTAFGGGQYPLNVGDRFWQLLDDARNHREAWVSGASFVNEVWPRYQSAGLLPARGSQ